MEGNKPHGGVDWVAVMAGCNGSKGLTSPAGIWACKISDGSSFIKVIASGRATTGHSTEKDTQHMLPKAFFSKSVLDNLYSGLVHVPAEIRSDAARNAMIHQDKKRFVQARVLTPVNLIWTVCQILKQPRGMESLLAVASGETVFCYNDKFQIADSVAVSNYQNRLMIYAAMFGGLRHSMTSLALNGVQWLKPFTLTGENAACGQWFKGQVNELWARHAIDENGMADLATIISPEGAKKLAVRISKLYANTSAPSIGKWNFFVLDLDDNASDTIKGLFNVGTVYPTRSEFCRIGVSRITSPDFLVKTVITGRPTFLDVKASNGVDLSGYAIAATSSVKSGGATIAKSILENQLVDRKIIDRATVEDLNATLEDNRIEAVFFIRGVRHEVSGWLVDGREMRATNLYSTYGLKALDQDEDQTEEELLEDSVEVEDEFTMSSASGASLEGLAKNPQFPVINTVRKMIAKGVVGHSFKLGHLTQQDFHNMVQDLGWNTTKEFMDIVWDDLANRKTVESFNFLKRYNSSDLSNTVQYEHGNDPKNTDGTLLKQISDKFFDGRSIMPNECNVRQANALFGGKNFVGKDEAGNDVFEYVEGFDGFLNSEKDIAILIAGQHFIFPNKNLARGWFREGNPMGEGSVILLKGGKLLLKLLSSYRSWITGYPINWEQIAIEHKVAIQEYVFGKTAGEVKVNAKTYVLLPAWWATEHHHVYMSSMKGTREALYGKLPVLFTHGNTKVLVHGKDHFPAELSWMFDPAQNGNGNAEFGNKEAIYVHPHLLLAQQNDADGDGARICFLPQKALDLIPFYKDQDQMYSAWHQKYIADEQNMTVRVKKELVIKDCLATKPLIRNQIAAKKIEQGLIHEIHRLVSLAQDCAYQDSEYCLAALIKANFDDPELHLADMIARGAVGVFLDDVTSVFDGGNFWDMKFKEGTSSAGDYAEAELFKEVQAHWDRITRATENESDSKGTMGEVSDEELDEFDSLGVPFEMEEKKKFKLNSTYWIDEIFELVLKLVGYQSPVTEAANAACKAKADVAIMSSFLYRIEQACQYLLSIDKFKKHEELLRRFQQIVPMVIQDEAMRQAKHSDKTAGLLQFIGTAQWNKIRSFDGIHVKHLIDGFKKMFEVYCDYTEDGGNLDNKAKIKSIWNDKVMETLVFSVVKSSCSVKSRIYEPVLNEKKGVYDWIAARPLFNPDTKSQIYTQNAIFSNGQYKTVRTLVSEVTANPYMISKMYHDGVPMVPVTYWSQDGLEKQVPHKLVNNGVGQGIDYDKDEMHEVEYKEFLNRTVFIQNGHARDCIMKLITSEPRTMNEVIIAKNLHAVASDEILEGQIAKLSEDLNKLKAKGTDYHGRLLARLEKLNGSVTQLDINYTRYTNELIANLNAELKALEEELELSLAVITGHQNDLPVATKLYYGLCAEWNENKNKTNGLNKEDKQALSNSIEKAKENKAEIEELLATWIKGLADIKFKISKKKEKIAKVAHDRLEKLCELKKDLSEEVEVKGETFLAKLEKEAAQVMKLESLLLKAMAKRNPLNEFATLLSEGRATPPDLETDKIKKAILIARFIEASTDGSFLSEEDGMATFEHQAALHEYSEEDLSYYASLQTSTGIDIRDYAPSDEDFNQEVPAHWDDYNIPSIEVEGSGYEITGDIPSDISDIEEVEDDRSDDEFGLDF